MNLQMLRPNNLAVGRDGAIDRDLFYWLGKLLTDARFLTTVEPCATMLRSPLSTVGSFTLVTGTAYFCYVGRVAKDITPTYCRFHVFAGAAGDGTSECGFFRSAAAPAGATTTLTKLVSGVTGTIVGAGVKSNSTIFDTIVRDGTHLWAGMRLADATPPDIVGLTGDMGMGHVLELTGAGAFSSTSTFAATVPAVAGGTIAPDLRGQL